MIWRYLRIFCVKCLADRESMNFLWVYRAPLDNTHTHRRNKWCLGDNSVFDVKFRRIKLFLLCSRWCDRKLCVYRKIVHCIAGTECENKNTIFIRYSFHLREFPRKVAFIFQQIRNRQLYVLKVCGCVTFAIHFSAKGKQRKISHFDLAYSSKTVKADFNAYWPHYF